MDVGWETLNHLFHLHMQRGQSNYDICFQGSPVTNHDKPIHPPNNTKTVLPAKTGIGKVSHASQACY